MLSSRFIFFTLIVGLTICALGFLPDAGISAQSHSVPYDSDFGPSFDDATLNYSYPTTYERLKDVDFRNLTLQLFDERGKPETRAKLKEGWYEHRENGTYESVKLDSVHYLPAETSAREYAVVLCTWFSVGGSSGTDGIAQIFELLDHRLTLKQQLDWDEHFDTNKPKISFNAKSSTLTVRTAHYLPGDSHCCVSAMDVITLQWQGNSFIKRAVRTELSDYGMRSGKKI